MTYPHHPRFGSNYRGLTNRLDLLLECYCYLSFEERVRTDVRAWQIEALRCVGRRTATTSCQVVAASARAARSHRGPLPARGRSTTPIEILTRTPRTLDGAPRRRDDPAPRALRRHHRGRPPARPTSCRRRSPRTCAARPARSSAGVAARARSRSPRSTGFGDRGRPRDPRGRARSASSSVDVADAAPRGAAGAAGRAHRPAARRDRRLPVRARERRRRGRERPRRRSRALGDEHPAWRLR